jgi:hypothetical protein
LLALEIAGAVVALTVVLVGRLAQNAGAGDASL